MQASFAFAPLDYSPPFNSNHITSPWPPDQPIRLCALRVEFREDNITGTTGNGKMESWFPIVLPNGDSLVIDPLPHDSIYFADHLLFLQDYFRVASNGRVRFDTMVVFPPGEKAAYQLDYPMWHYNYNIGDEQLNHGLIQLFSQAVWKADSAGVDFTKFDAVIVFHAGVGRDFNIGYDATPFDIPSAYINERDLAGVRMPPGVTRGLILPEGENQQEVLDFGVQLSLNGIMVKLFGNWLGLPDLFDTNTGRSGVGRWAMMDQGSGNANALVPALPDAWSRVFMNWDTAAICIPSGRGDTVSVARFGNTSAPRVVKLPISGGEYYLIENRDADADSVGFVELTDRAGRTLRFKSDGTMLRTPGFRVAVQASHYDFGIPGSGLLIWHIDEDVIEREYEANRVNGDPDRRGVDLVEADGPQDIGQEYFFASASAGTELGIQEDCWYQNNPAHRTANGGNSMVTFSDQSFPSARLYDGAYTGLELVRFSKIDTVMTFVARHVYTAPGFPIELPDARMWDWRAADLNGDGRYELCLLGSELMVFDSLGAIIGRAPGSGFHFSQVLSPYDLDSDGKCEILLESDSGIAIVRFTDSLAVRYSPISGEIGISVLPAQSCTDVQGRILQMSTIRDSSRIILYDLDFHALDSLFLPRSRTRQGLVNIESIPACRFVFSASQYAACLQVDGNELTLAWEIHDDLDPSTIAIVAGPGRRTVFLGDFGYIEALTGSVVCRIPECVAPKEDWDADGIPDGGGPFGRTSDWREDFPEPIDGTPEIVDLDADGQADVLSFYLPNRQQQFFQRIDALAHSKERYTSFPVATSETPPHYVTWARDLGLHYSFEYREGNRTYFALRRLPVRLTGTQRTVYRDESSIYVVGSQRAAIHDRSDWLYCWPNPASSLTNIRITWSHAATADVVIFDLAGRRVAGLHGMSSLPGAFEVPWNVVNVESGVYVARVRVSGGGKTAESQVKIAVVK